MFFSISSIRFKQLAEEITHIFPGERTELYYVPYCRGLNGRPISPRGILWDKYVNKRRILRQIGLLTKNGNSSAEG